MDFRETIATRRSIRAFRPDPVAPELVEQVIREATDAPSWGNTQPYRLAIARGSLLDAIGAELEQRFMKLRTVRNLPKPLRPLGALLSSARPDGDFNTLINYPPELAARYRETGFGLYATLGIRRDDYAARDAQMAKNFRGFGAPVVIFVFMHGALGVYGAADTGAFVQSLALAAHDRGLGTCIQGAMATWVGPIRQRFEVPKTYKLLCGVALGYPADDPVNTYRPERLPVRDLLLRPR